MATLGLGETTFAFAVIYADGEGVPISFPLDNDGVATSPLLD
jgi:hypothetical protein